MSDIQKLFTGMQPIMVIPPDMMSAGDVELLRKNGICVVVAKDPAKVKFIDPIPSVSNRTEIENAAIGLSRKLLNKGACPWDDATRGNVARMFVDLLVKGTQLDLDVEREQEYFTELKMSELRRLAAEEARAERKAAKEAKEAEAKKKGAA